ncbi:Cupredoxin [Hortaea werneckii]|nr:Cupredoxin [Hortaea werneckii]
MATTLNMLALSLAAASSVSAQGFIGPPWRGAGRSAGSPDYSDYLYQSPLPIPPVAQPDFTETVDGRQVEFYTMTIEPFTQQVYPNLGAAHLIGYNGTAPGPSFYIKKDTETIIRYLNNGEESSAVHLHGSYTHSAWDGWAADEMEVGQWKDYYYPNTESARPMWYHDHAEGHTSTNAYFGQAGVYIIYDPEEDKLGLPSGDYDIPLALSDKTYQSNGDLASPGGNPINFFGDTIHVNEQPWPYLSVEPRKYRLRFFDMSISRPYDLYFQDPDGNWIDFEVIASDSGLFGGPVKTNDVVISMGERYEVVFDFSGFAGKNITLKNNMQQNQISEFDNTDKVMRFVVGEEVSDDSNNGQVPSTLNDNIQWPAQKDTVDHSFNFQMGGDDTWTINGVSFNDVNNRILARPPQGSVQLWELRHTGGPGVHPVHIHLVNLQVVSRTGGSRGLLPYEAAGLKDVVLLEPGETVRVLAFFGPWNGVYMFHCHNLVHEDHTMLDAFNVTKLSELGYDFSDVQQYGDPEDPRFSAQEYSDEAFTPDAERSAALSLASMGAYAPMTSIIAAEEAYYSTAGYNGDSSPGHTTKTVAPSSSGYGFATSTATASTAATEVQKDLPFGFALPTPPPLPFARAARHPRDFNA